MPDSPPTAGGLLWPRATKTEVGVRDVLLSGQILKILKPQNHRRRTLRGSTENIPANLFILQQKNRGPERGSHTQVTHRAELNTMGSCASCLLLEHQLHATYSVEETVYLPWNLGAELCRCKKPQQGSMLLARAHSCAFPGGGGYLLTPRGDSGFVLQYTELPRLPAASD